jgi:hypothetical protein
MGLSLSDVENLFFYVETPKFQQTFKRKRLPYNAP